MKLARYKNDSQYSYALGATLVYELLKTHPELIQRAFLRPNINYGKDLQTIIDTLRQHNIEIIESTKAFNILGAKDSCLLAAEFQKPNLTLDNSKPHIVLVNPSDSGNLGTIIRTAAAFDITDIAIILPAVDAYHPKVVRSSMGAIFHMNICTYRNINEYLDIISRDRKIFAFLLDRNAQPIQNITNTTECYSLVFGNEASGLPENFTTTTNSTPVFIPQSASVDSLNLSIAAGIAIYHFTNKNN